MLFRSCGICDVCISRKKASVREEPVGTDERILQLLAGRDVPVNELVRGIGVSPEVVVERIRVLLDEGKIRYVTPSVLGLISR